MKIKQKFMERAAIIILVVAVATVAISATFGRYRYWMICDKCAMIQSRAEWHLPLTELFLYRHSQEKPTPVSRILLQDGIVAGHEHHWVFGTGGGNGIKCAIGLGRHIFPAAESEGVAAIIDASHRYGAHEFRDRVVGALLDPQRSDTVSSLQMIVPKGGFPNAEAFKGWMDKETPFVYIRD